jgi:hypothetical protein
MYGNFPESPEAVALELLRLIEGSDHKETRRSNAPESTRVLDLYAECLAAARGDRAAPADRAALH